MRFMSGMIIGGMLVAGATWMYGNSNNPKKIIKRGRQLVKKMGLM